LKSKGKAIPKNVLPLQFLAAQRSNYLPLVSPELLVVEPLVVTVVEEVLLFATPLPPDLTGVPLSQPTTKPKPNSKANAKIFFIFSTLNQISCVFRRNLSVVLS
jgi:hypothetical protein